MRKAGAKQIVVILLGALVVGIMAGVLAANWPRFSILR